MAVVFKESGVRLEPILRDYVEKKIAKVAAAADRFGRGVLIRVEIGRETGHHRKGRIFRAEINCDIPGIPKRMVRAESTDWDVRTALDLAVGDLLRQLVRLKGRFSARTKAGARELKRRIRGEEA